MSQSQREIQHKKQLSNTLYTHNRKHSRKFTHLNPTEGLVDKGKSLYQAGLLKPALAQFQQAIKISADVPIDIHYLCGIICMAENNHSQAAQYLRRVSKIVGDFKSNTYLLLAICLHKMNQDEEALTLLHPICDKSNPQGLVYRGKILFKKQQFEKAASDFTKLLEQGHAVAISTLFLQQCHFKMGRSQEALHGISCFLQNPNGDLKPETKKRGLSLKAQILISLNRCEEAMQIINQNLQKDPKDSEILYLKALVHKQRGEDEERNLALNQCITVKNNKKAVTQALEELIITSLRHKDFYEAFQYSKRSSFMNINNKTTTALYKLSEGLTFLMKKKFGQALLMIGAVEGSTFAGYQDKVFLNNLCCSALGYAYFSLGEHSDALKMYKKISLDEDAQSNNTYLYNINLCEGIQAHEEGKLEDSIKLFQGATDYLIRPEPYLYISVILIQRGLASNAASELFMQVLQIIDTGLKVGQNCQMYYYRSLLYFYLGMNAEALDDVDRAIEKSEDNVARYFYLRALIFFQERNYEQGISECSTCLSIDEKFYDAFLERAKMKLICDETQEAYQDLNAHPMKAMWIPLFRLYERKFHRIIENDSAESNIKQTAHFHLGLFNQAGAAGKIILAIICESYAQVLKLIDEALEISFPVGCLDIDDIHILRSYCCFRLNRYDQALQQINKAQELLKKEDNRVNESQDDQKKLLAIKVNAIWISLKKKEWEQGYQLCEALINDVYEGAIYDQLIKLREFIQNGKGQNKQNKEQLGFHMLENVSMISDYLPDEELEGATFKFLIPMPKVRVLDIQVVPYEQPLLDFTIKEIQNRAEAPWMRKDEYGVIFTNTVQKFQNLNLCTQENQEPKNSKQRIKEQLQLDPHVLNKLEKLQQPRHEEN